MFKSLGSHLGLSDHSSIKTIPLQETTNSRSKTLAEGFSQGRCYASPVDTGSPCNRQQLTKGFGGAPQIS